MKPQVCCPVCGSESLTTAAHSLKVSLPEKELLVSGLEHYECAVCGADPSFPDQIRRNELKIADAKRRAQGLLTAAEIREIREELGLSQADAAILFGGGTHAFSKYERGAVIQSVPMDRLLRVVHAYPYVANFLRTECTVQTGAYSGATSGAAPPFFFTPAGGWKSSTRTEPEQPLKPVVTALAS